MVIDPKEDQIMVIRKSIAVLAVLTAIFTVACESDQDPGGDVGTTLAPGGDLGATTVPGMTDTTVAGG